MVLVGEPVLGLDMTCRVIRSGLSDRPSSPSNSQSSVLELRSILPNALGPQLPGSVLRYHGSTDKCPHWQGGCSYPSAI